MVAMDVSPGYAPLHPGYYFNFYLHACRITGTAEPRTDSVV